jgi:hypothetical protein
MTNKRKMTPEQEAKLKQALEIAKSINRRLDKTERIMNELLAEQENRSSESAT